jgi:predicted transcriptional regulator
MHTTSSTPEEFRARRVVNRVRQLDVAIEAQVHDATVSRYESGHTTRPATVRAIVDALDRIIGSENDNGPHKEGR